MTWIHAMLDQSAAGRATHASTVFASECGTETEHFCILSASLDHEQGSLKALLTGRIAFDVATHQLASSVHAACHIAWSPQRALVDLEVMHAPAGHS